MTEKQTFEQFAENAKNINSAPLDGLPINIREVVEEDIKAGELSEKLHKDFGIDIIPDQNPEEESKS